MVCFVEMHCGKCGIEFAVPDFFERERRETGKGWFCPNGHSRVYCESDVARLTRENNLLAQQIARVEQEAQEAHARLVEAEEREARLKRRASAGICPCCKRSFTALARHMKMKHPEFSAPVVVIGDSKKRA